MEMLLKECAKTIRGGYLVTVREAFLEPAEEVNDSAIENDKSQRHTT